MIKLLYTSDLHGSDIVFNKLISHAKHNKVDAVIIGGDLSGKTLTPIIKTNHHHFTTEFLGKQVEFSENELNDYIRKINNIGSYHTIFEKQEYFKLDLEIKSTGSAQKLQDILNKRVNKKLRKWLTTATNIFQKHGIKLIVIGGNDDEWEIDKIISEFPEVQNPDVNPFIFKGYTFIGESTTNITPFGCPRDISELEIVNRLNRKMDKLSDNQIKNLIFIAHCPPKGSGLDVASKIENGKILLKGGQPVSVNVGSSAILNFINEYEPIISLHGHIHESYGNTIIHKTHSFNPGSEYYRGTFRGYLIQIEDRKVYSHLINA